MLPLPLGSCRIWNPLLALKERRQPPKLFQGGSIYVHTPAGALQLLRLLRGDLTLESGWHCYIKPTLPLRLSPTAAQMVKAADVCFVEICSDKEYHVGDVLLHDNEIARQCREPQGVAHDEWTLALERGQDIPASAVEIKAEWIAKRRALTPEDWAVLTEIRCRRLTPERLRLDIAALAKALHCPLVVVPHISFRTADGEVLASRERFIGMVREASRDIGVPVFSHGELLQEYGQNRLFAEGGKDPYHFDPSLNLAVGRRLLRFASTIQRERHQVSDSLCQ